MYFPFSTRTLALVFLVLIIDMQYTYTQDAEENNDKNKGPSNLSLPKSLTVPCHALKSPIDNIKSALKDLELMSEIYCTTALNSPPPDTVKAESTVEPQQNQAQASDDQHNQVQISNNDQEPLASRAITYPFPYHQPWIHYPQNYLYNYADRSHQAPNYYYSPPRSPYIPIYPAVAPLPPSSPPSPFMFEENLNNGIYGAHENSTDITTTSVLIDNEMKKKKKMKSKRQRCPKKRTSRRTKNSRTINVNDENDDNTSETDLDINSHAEMKSN